MSGNGVMEGGSCHSRGLGLGKMFGTLGWRVGVRRGGWGQLVAWWDWRYTKYGVYCERGESLGEEDLGG